MNSNYIIQYVLGNLFQSLNQKDNLIKYQDIKSASNGIDYFYNRYFNLRTTFNILTHLNDHLLKDIPKEITFPIDKTVEFPNDEITPSLFQVFQLLRSAIDQATPHQSDKKTSNLIEGNHKRSTLQYNEISLPNSLQLENINRSYSIKVLNDTSKEVLTRLNDFKLQRTCIKSEVQDVDEQIERLNKLKNDMNERIHLLRENEMKLKDTAMAIKTRKDFVREYGLNNKEANNCDDDILDKYLTESKSFLEDYNMNIYQGEGSLPSTSQTDSPSMPQMFLPDSASDIMSTSEELSKFYDGPHRKQKYISTSLQEIYQPGSTVAIFKKAHDDNITCLDFDFPFGTMITAGYMDHTMKIWDLSGRKQVGLLEGHYASINCIQMDPNFNLVVSGSKDATLKLWNIDLATEEGNAFGIKLDKSCCIHSLDSHKAEINALSLDREILVSASKDKTIKQWDLKSGRCIQNLDVAFTGTKSPKVEQESFSLLDPPIVGGLQCFENALATGTKDGLIRLWDLRSGKVVRTIDGHDGAITTLRFDSKNLLTGSVDQTVRLWDLRYGNEVDKFYFESPISNVHFDSQRIVISTQSTSSVYDRVSLQQWDCTQPVDFSSTVSSSQYKDGYMIEGRSNGNVTVWSV
ncbi:mitochondrial division protein 1 [Monosporozyma servazzii]